MVAARSRLGHFAKQCSALWTGVSSSGNGLGREGVRMASLYIDGVGVVVIIQRNRCEGSSTVTLQHNIPLVVHSTFFTVGTRASQR